LSVGNSDCSTDVRTNDKNTLDHIVKQALTRRRFVISLVYANLLWWNVTYAQRSSGSFGPCTERTLGFTPRCLSIASPIAGQAQDIAVLGDDPPALHFVTLGKDGSLIDTAAIPLPKPQGSVSFLETDRQGKSSFVAVSEDAKEISIIRRVNQRADVQSFEAPVRVQKILVADINNDKRKDLLLFGKSSAGVTTLLGTPGGSFKAGPVLFPEISVSDMKTMDLNGDGVADVMLLNWLSNELVVFYGITGTVFSEQVTVQLPGEPADLAVTEVSRDRRIRAAVTIPDGDRIVCLTGNSTGEFEQDASIETHARTDGVNIVDIDGDGLPDVISSTPHGILAAMARGAHSFATPAYFVDGGPGVLWGVGDVDHDHHPDLIVARQNSRRLLVAANANHAGTISWPECYAVGLEPHGVCLGDFNHDGLMDIAVANSGSSTISLLLNGGEGKFHGQISLSVPERPLFLRGAPARTHEGYTLLVSHSAQDLITVVNFSGDVTRPLFYTMPTGQNPYVLLANDDPRSRKLKILVRYRNEKDASISLSLFEQLNGKLFLERNLKAKIPHRITALTVADILGQNDLLVATHDRASGTSTVSLASSAGTFDFKNVRSLFSLSDSSASIRSLACSPLAASERKDIFLVLSEPRNAIGISRGRAEGVFQDSLEWIRDVRPLDDAAIEFDDVDGDGIGDLVVLDSYRKAVVVYYGESRGSFGPPVVVCPAPGVNAFAVGMLRERGPRDLVLTHGTAGTVSISYHPFRR
jgi:hypothetical protein